MKAEGNCPVCNVPGIKRRGDLDYNCACCGEFLLDAETKSQLIKKEESNPQLAAWLRSQNESGNTTQLTLPLLKKISDGLPVYSVSDKQHLLLNWLAKQSKFPGDSVSVITWSDWPINWSSNLNEFKFHLSSAQERGFISYTDKDPAYKCVITTQGWNQLDKIAGELIIEDRAFVAMSFHKELDSAWKNGIKKGIEKAGYAPYRVDSKPHIDRIDLKIIGDIRSSRFVIADVTQHSQGVYFEAGYALALGRPVIWSVRKNHLGKAHFDTRQFHHIIWKDEKDLAKQLEEVIAGVMGRRKKLY